MRKPTRFQQLLLSAAFTAAPALCNGADLPRKVLAAGTSGLRPAIHERELQIVPSDRSIRLVQYQSEQTESPAATSTVNAELQRMFQQNGQPAPRFAVQQTSRKTPAATAETQEGVQQAAATPPFKSRRQLRREWREQNPGPLTRFIRGLQQDEEEGVDESGVEVGEPAPQIPAPPPLVYNGSGTNTNGSVRAMNASFEQQKMGTPPLIPGAGVLPDNSTAQGETPRTDGFVNPFVDLATTEQRDVLLDLDSLISEEQPKTAAPLNGNFSAETVDLATQEEASAMAVVREAAEQEESNARLDQEEPFTGYILDLATTAETPAEFTQQDSRGIPEVPPVPDEEEPARPLLPAETVSHSQVGATPAMQLPPVESTSDEVNISDSASDKQDSPMLDASDFADVSEAQQETSTQDQEASVSSTEPEAAATDDRANAPVPQPADSDQIIDSRAKLEYQRYLIMSRTGQTGFKGFCPVELRDNRELVDSHQEYRARFGLQTYFFSTQEARTAFESNPSRYAPAAGGSDVVLLVNTGEDVSGSLDFSLWYHDRLYLFRSRESQQIFSQNPAKFADQY